VVVVDQLSVLVDAALAFPERSVVAPAGIVAITSPAPNIPVTETV